jgi:hypothetical protein
MIFSSVVPAASILRAAYFFFFRRRRDLKMPSISISRHL